MTYIFRKIKAICCTKSVLQFIKFGIVGLSNTLIGLAIYYIFIYCDAKLYLAGNIVGWVVSVANAFFWSNRFVFKDAGGSILGRLFKTYISYGGSFLLAMALLVLQVEVLGINAVIAPLINLIITVPMNFVINKYWTFRKMM